MFETVTLSGQALGQRLENENVVVHAFENSRFQSHGTPLPTFQPYCYHATSHQRYFSSVHLLFVFFGRFPELRVLVPRNVAFELSVVAKSQILCFFDAGPDI
jgi:hypothetical protein